MTTNGNGATDPRMQQAMRVLVKAKAPLEELDGAIAKLQQQMATVNTAVASAERQFDDAQGAYVDDDGPVNRKRLFVTRDDLAAAQSKVKPIVERIARLQIQRSALDVKVQEAAVTLAKITDDVRLEYLEREESVAKYKIAQAQQQIFELQKRFNAARDERMALLRRLNDARWRQQKATARADWLRAGNDDPDRGIAIRR